jgi:ATPase components of various ABC-type transport systems, contain duplicated ATPase
MTPILEVTNFSYTYPDTEESIFSEGISFSVSAGECVCLTGPSGCGKTTLLLAIQGLLRGGEVGGSIKITGNSSTVAGGMVFQNAESQILCTTVEDEVAFGPENLGLPADEITGRVHESLAAVGLAGFEKRNVEELSAGETHRLTIASVLSMKPGLLLLDEPTCQLDGPGKERLMAVLQSLKKQGQALLVADHDLNPYQDIASRFIFLDNGQPHQTIAFSQSNVSPGKNASHPKEKPAIVVDDLQVLGSAPDRPLIFQSAHVTVYQGELIHLFGLNGAGKSTFLRCLVGFVTPEAGNIQIVGMNSPRPERMLGKVGFLSQNPQRQLFEDTVFAEVAFSLKRMGLSAQQIHEWVTEALSLCDISLLAERSPLTLSFGEQHRVALASAIACHPKVLLFDEPFSGLDFSLRKRILDILSELRQRQKTTVLIASHDRLPDKHWADRSVVVEQGKLYAS